MLYTHENLTLDISRYDDDFLGMCRFTIPFSHKEFLRDNCGVEKNDKFRNDGYDAIFVHRDYGAEIYI